MDFKVPVLSAPLDSAQSYTAQHSHRSSAEDDPPSTTPAKSPERSAGPSKSPTAAAITPTNAVLVETKGGKAIAIPKLWVGAAPMNEEAEAGEKEKKKQLLQKHIEQESEKHEEEKKRKALERKQKEHEELKRTGKHLNGKVKEAPPRANRPPLTSPHHSSSAPVMSETMFLDLHKDASSDPLRDALPEATELVGEIRQRPKQKSNKPPALDPSMVGGALAAKGFPKEPIAGLSTGTRLLQPPVNIDSPSMQDPTRPPPPAASASPIPPPITTPSAQKSPPSPPAKKSSPSHSNKAMTPSTPSAAASTPSASVSPPPRPQAPPVPARTPKPVPRGTDPFMTALGQILPGSSSSGMARAEDGTPRATPRATPRRSLQIGGGNGLLHHKPVNQVYTPNATPKNKSPLAASGPEQGKGSLNGAWIPEASLGIETV